jgi:alcohol dehydrogenase
MKAIQIKDYGSAEVIETNPDAQKPSVEKGKVIVEINAVSLNRIDSVIRNGYMKEMVPLQFPITLAGDFAGVVSEIGEDVTEFKIGDAVYGNAGPLKGGSGSLAEFTLASVSNISLKPESLDFVKSAALPLVGSSALQGIEDEIKLEAGQKILIQGGAGGIGALAIQLAKLKGAYVATTVSSDDVDLAKSLGADEVIDYKAQDVTQVLKDYDAVLDTAGGESMNKLFAVLKKGGKFVTLAGQPDQELAKQHEVTALSQMTNVSSQQLTKLAELVNSNKLKVQVEKTFPFTQAKDAFVYFETQHPKGKIVVEIK